MKQAKKYLAMRVETNPRKCMLCGKMFASTWIGNRRCAPCKAKAAAVCGTQRPHPAERADGRA